MNKLGKDTPLYEHMYMWCSVQFGCYQHKYEWKGLWCSSTDSLAAINTNVNECQGPIYIR